MTISAIKKAIDPAVMQAIQQEANRQLRSQALRDVLGYGAAGIGVGASLRGLQTLLRLGAGAVNTGKPAPSVPSGLLAELPLPMDDDVEEKQSFDVQSVLDFGAGKKAITPEGVPWFLPAAVGLPALGAVGGWKFMDWIMDKRRKGAVKQDVEDAKREYEQALLESQGIKSSSCSELGATLDKLYDTVVEKTAGRIADIGGQLSGVYLLAAMMAGTMSGVGGYNWAKKRSRRKVVEKALKNLKRKQQMQQPAPIYVQPHYVPRQTAPAIDTDLTGPVPSLAAQEDAIN
jgi:hypothetical protein